MFKKLKYAIIVAGLTAGVISLYADIKSVELSNWRSSSEQTHIFVNKGQLQLRFNLDYKNKDRYPSAYKMVNPPRKIIDENIKFEVYTDSDRPLPKPALTIGFYVGAKTYIFTVPVKIRKWVKVSIPLRGLRNKKCRQIYFQIVESWYKKSGFEHGDKVKFKIKGLRFAGFESRKLSIDKIIDSSPEIIYSHPDLTKVVMDFKVTHNTKMSLRIDINKSLGDLNFKGVYKGPSDTYIWIKLSDHDIDIENFTKLSYYLKMKGGRHAYIKLGFADEPRRGRLYATHAPIDAGDWRRYTNPFNMPAPKYLGIQIYMSGYNVDEDPMQSIYIDDLQLSNTPLRQSRGWSIDPTIIAVNQAGFSPYKEKLAVANAKFIKQAFKVIDNSDGKTYFRGRIEPEKSLIGSTGIIDFTKLARPGNYKIVSGPLKSASFNININAYDKCISLVSDWVANMRCGCKTDLHAPCHLDDAYLPDLDKDGNIISRKHYDFSGGWHDAGDVRTYYFYSFSMGRWLLPAYRAGWARDHNSDGVEDYYDSALWAMKHLIKIRDPRDGRFLAKIADHSFNKNEKFDYRFGNYWTDNIPDNHDDRYARTSGKWGNTSATLAIESIALFAKAAKPKDKQLADKLLSIAEERWDYWFHPETGELFTEQFGKYQSWKGVFTEHSIRNVGWYGSATLALYIATGRKEKKYYDFIIRCAKKIIESQNRTFSSHGNITGDVFVTASRKMKSLNLLTTECYKYACENFIADLMKSFPEHNMYYKWRSFLVIGKHWWMKSIRNKMAPFSLPHSEVKKENMEKNDFGFLVNKDKQKRYQYIIPLALSYQIGEEAYHMWNVAVATNDIELENLAMRQLQWMIGFNPFGVSFVCEYGEDYIDQFYSFTQGIMPGQIGTSAGMGKYTGVREKGIPGVIRPTGSETVTRGGAVFCSALAILSRPARLKLKIMNGNVAYKNKVEIIWSKTQSVVFEGDTDSQGNLPVVNLDGGQLYTIKIGKTTVPLKLISGTKISKTIDLTNLINIAAQSPDVIKAGKPFKTILSVTNSGRESVNTEILCFGESVKSKQQSQKLKLAVGETKKIDWTFFANSKPGPYVISFKENHPHAKIIDVLGKIHP